VTYLGERNIGIFSCDLDSFDFKASKPAEGHRHRHEQGGQARQGRIILMQRLPETTPRTLRNC